MPRPVFGRYIPRESVIHRLDPRFKLACAAALMAAVFLLDGWPDYALLAAAVVLATRMARLRWGELSQGLAAVSLLMAIGFFLQLAFTPGEVLARLGPVTLSRPGLYAGLALAGRLAFLATLSALLGFTTPSASLADGLDALLRPLQRLGVPTRRVTLVIGVGMRFVPTILEQGEGIVKAQKARGIDFSQGSLLKRAKRLLAVFIPLLRACLRRADDLAQAMDARGYRLDGPRSRWQPLRAERRDWIGALACGGVVALVLWL